MVAWQLKRMKIRITSTPPGEAPEHIRQAWVGLVVPVHERYAGPQTRLGVGVLTGPRTWLGVLLAMLTGRAKRATGHVVDAKTALELLATHAPHAAVWWHTHAPRFLEPGRFFLLAVDVCEEVHERPAVEWLVPWHPVDDPAIRRSLLAELQRELPKGHVLTGASLTAIGRRQDRDDVLFALSDGRVAIVHLTWSGKCEPVPTSPWTMIFDSLNRFIEEEMKPEHRDWG
jgi:hypothetical protein